MTAAHRNRIRVRAGYRCEYCGLHEDDRSVIGFQIEHVIPKKHGGSNDASNLAYSCPTCNRHKGPNLAGIDPQDGSLVPLFNPRTQDWEDHFEVLGSRIEGITSIGRVTVLVLVMNGPEQVDRRTDREV